MVFVTADGTAATFISDTTIYDYSGPIYTGSLIIYPSGFLALRDGTRYRIDNGRVTWLRDANGNRLSFTYGTGGVTSITDSLNRQITINYNVSDAAPYGLCDQITFKGFGGASRMIRVSKTSLGNALRSGHALQTYSQLFPQLTNSTTQHNPTVVSAVWLPDGNRRYQLFYNSYGELARVVLPTGGAFEYDFGAGIVNGWASGVFQTYDWLANPVYEIYRRVLERRVYPDGGTGSAFESKMTYSRPEDTFGGNLGYVVMDQLNQSGTLLTRERHYYTGKPTSSFSQDPLGYPTWTDGKEYQTEAFSSNGTTVLRRVAHTWQQGCPVSTWSTTIPNNPRISETVSTLVDTNQVTKQGFTYDCYNNQTDIREYNYGTGASPVHPTRRTHVDYLTTNPVNGVNYATDTSIHLRSLPLRQQVYAVNPSTGAETWAAQTEYEYDKYDASTGHAALTNRTNISGLDSAFTTAYTRRGNLTQVSRWRNSGGTLLVKTYAQYDIAGNVVKAIDGRGNATTFDFADRFGAPNGEARANTAPAELGTLSSFAFATKVTNALNQSAYTQFDYYLGRPVDSEDANGVVASASYNDALDRPKQVIRANTASPADPNKNQTTFNYNDAGRLITTTSDRSGYNDNLLKSEVLYDGLGRTVEARSYETASAYITVKTNYDALGRAFQVSNPYRAGDTVLWTTTAYDALGRIISVTTPDGAAVTTAYNGNRVLVTDQASKRRLSQTNALGHLTDVWEIRAADSATESVSFPGYPTVTAGYRSKYVYDALDNLTTVTQQVGTSGTTQTRSFVYDPLARLTSAANPESGTITYQYDDNGNLTSKTDARNITTTLSYDVLNRPTAKIYTGSTPRVDYFYDNQTLPSGAPSYSRGSAIGRLVGVTYGGVSQGNYYGYDTLGRATIKYQRTGTTNYQAQAGYNLAGAVTSGTYPSGRTVSYAYDTAGRLSGFSGTLGDGLQRTYASVTQYSAAGLMERESYGTGTNGMTTPLYLKLHYNKRQQMVDLRLSSVNDATNWNRGALIFYYGTNAVANWNPFLDDADNNGNVRRALHYVPKDDQVSAYAIPMLHDYSYDALNRIASVAESYQTEAGVWTLNYLSQTFGYDRYGNRQITAATGGVNNYNPTYNLSNNRINGLGYDAAGNITTDVLTGGTMTYDAENHMLTASSGGGGNYVYDGEGKRIKRVLAGGQEWWYVYGVGGELLAEYLASAPATVKKEYGYRDGQLLVVWNGDEAGDKRLKWLVTDHLGSTRMEADQSGSLTGMTRHDYLPFGEELSAGIRRTAQGQGQYGYEPPASNVRQKFAEYERDNESGLDYAQARYFASTQGRFTSPDPLLGSGQPTQPQSWNRYSYTINNPLLYTDPTGLIWGYHDKDGVRTFTWYDNDKALKAAGDTVYTQGYYDTGDGQRLYLNPDGPGNKVPSHLTATAYNVSYFNSGYMLTPIPKFPMDGAPNVAREPGIETDWGTQLALGGLFQVASKGVISLLSRQAIKDVTEEATIHGAQRLAERGFSAADVALTKTGLQKIQADGAKVFIKEVAPGKFNVIVEGQRGVVTALKTISQKAVDRLAQRYGWK